MFQDDTLKGFLVDQIWDKWTNIPAASRQLATQSLGENFQNMFLDGKAYDRIEKHWRLGLIAWVSFPETEETVGGIGPLSKSDTEIYNKKLRKR